MRLPALHAGTVASLRVGMPCEHAYNMCSPLDRDIALAYQRRLVDGFENRSTSTGS